MKRLWLFLFIIQFGFCAAQGNSAVAKMETIKLKKYNVEKEIKNGSLSFLKGCFWTETVHVGKRTISTTRATPDALIGKKGIILIENIKKKNPDGSFQTLPPKQLVIE